MKLISLQVQAFKRVTTAILPIGAERSGIVALMGPNESGKSSTLDAFEALVAGRATPKRAMPVHKGEDVARIVGEFQNDDGSKITVTRRYKAAGGTDIVVQQDGLRVASPDAILRSLYSHIALDPLAFANLKSNEQADTLIRLIGFDPAPLDQERANAYATRTDVNREIGKLEARLGQYPAEDTALAAREPVSVATLTEQIAMISTRNNQRTILEREIDDAERQVARLDEQIRTLTAQRDDWKQSAADRQTERETLGDHENEESTRAQIRTAEATNDAIRVQQDRGRVAAELTDARERVAKLEVIMADVDARKAEAFATAEWPVPGLSIEDGIVHLDGTPFAETSAGRKLRTSTAIAMALNPTLRAIVIRDGSLLDKSNRKMIDEIATERDFVVLMEIVDENAETGVVFEDGEIVGTKGLDA